MPEPKKRIIVDGIDFWQVFQFPKILTAAASALQPPRLILGLLIIVSLITVGRLWDAWSTPRVHPVGLAVGLASETDLNTFQALLRDAVRGFAPDHVPNGGAPSPAPTLSETRAPGEDSRWPTLDAQTVQRWMRQEHARRMSSIADPKERDAERAQFRSQYELIERSRPLGAFEAVERYASANFNHLIWGVLDRNPGRAREGITELVINLPKAAWNNLRSFTVVYGLAFLVILSIGGGALSRMAACQFAGQERLRMREALDFALGNATRLVFAQALPLLIALIISIAIVALGLLLGVPVLDVIGGLFYGLVLLMGFLLAFLLIGYAFGFSLLVPAVACENCDGPDAMHRSYAYVISRPIHLAFYWIIYIIGLAIGFLLVSLVATVMLNLSAKLFGSTTSNPAISALGGYELLDLSHPLSVDASVNWHSRWTAGLFGLWQTVVVCLVAGYVFSYHFSASTIVYLLMRRAADGQDAEEIWRPGLVPGTQTPVPQPTETPATPA